MPKLSPIPRLSIVVPVGNCIEAYENTLVSVLENRPVDCEVLVAHDGSYDDPFDLSDEVRFIVASSSRMTDLVSAAAAAAKGRFVHVIAEGICATEGWTEPALEKFEHHDAGIVAPVIRHTSSRRVVAAGWSDTAARLCTSLASGAKLVDARTAIRVDGAYLQASFWRRQLLCSLADTLYMVNDIEAVYAHTLALDVAGWRTMVATQCEVEYPHATLAWDDSSFSRGQRLRAVHDVVLEEHGSAIGVSIGAMLRNILRPTRFAESLGQATAAMSKRSIRKRLNVDRIESIDVETVSMAREDRQEFRRAA